MLDTSEILIVCIVVHVYFVILTVRSTLSFPVLIIFPFDDKCYNAFYSCKDLDIIRNNYCRLFSLFSLCTSFSFFI